MAESLAIQLNSTSLKSALLEAVAAESLDQIPSDFDDQSRFVINAVRAVAHRPQVCALCVFVYSEAPVAEGKGHGFNRTPHMQDGHGQLESMAILTGRDANNGAARQLEKATVANLMDELEQIGLGDRVTVIWDGNVRKATVYPSGISNESEHSSFHIPAQSDEELTQNDICEVLDEAYNDNLKNPSGRTAKLFVKGKLVATAEDEIERHLKGQIAMFFSGRSRPISILSQINTSAGRTDLVFIQKASQGGPRLSGVLELKVLRGPLSSDREATREGLNQAFSYRNEIQMPFATLALYDVTATPSADTTPLLDGQDTNHLDIVRVRRFPIYDSPQAWRNAGGTQAA